VDLRQLAYLSGAIIELLSAFERNSPAQKNLDEACKREEKGQSGAGSVLPEVVKTHRNNVAALDRCRNQYFAS